MTLEQFMRKVEKEEFKSANPLAYTIAFVVVALISSPFVYMFFNAFHLSSLKSPEWDSILFLLIMLSFFYFVLRGIINTYKKYAEILEATRSGFSIYKKALSERDMIAQLNNVHVDAFGALCFWGDKACCVNWGKVFIFRLKDCDLNMIKNDIDERFIDEVELKGKDILREIFDIKVHEYVGNTIQEQKTTL